VAQVLGAMTGATDVALLIWNDEHRHWLLPATAHEGGASTSDTAPMSLLRYLERTREPLVVTDATRDDRFARDPYFADADCCSLLAIPILSRGILRALLLLENRLMRGAFTAERLSAVNLIAGQLAVSLDNAQLYGQLAASRARVVATADETRRRIERNLHDGAQQRLVSLALELRMAQAEVSPGAGELRTRLDRAVEQASSAIEELRDLSRGIHPAMLTERGLGPALRALGRRSPIPVSLDDDAGDRVSRRIGLEPHRLGVDEQGDVGEVEQGADGDDLGIGLGVDQARVPVAPGAADALAAAAIGLVEENPARGTEGVVAGGGQDLIGPFVSVGLNVVIGMPERIRCQRCARLDGQRVDAQMRWGVCKTKNVR